MKECWSEKNTRKQPQAIMRDINQILYQVYNSRRNHAYATAFPTFFNTDENDSIDDLDLEERISNSESQVLDSCSLNTDHTNLTWDDSDSELSDLIMTKINDIILYVQYFFFYVTYLCATIGLLYINNIKI